MINNTGLCSCLQRSSMYNQAFNITSAADRLFVDALQVVAVCTVLLTLVTNWAQCRGIKLSCF